MLRPFAQYLLKKLHLYGLYSLRVKGPLREDGWFRSFEEQRPVDAQGRPVPFITYPALEFLRRRIRPQMSVFEYGSGASTLWWAARVKEVVACEHNDSWYRRIASQAPENVTLLYRKLEYGGDYSRAILEYAGRFDVVVLDGRDRVNCAKNCLGALKPDGVILWDNSDRTSYEEGFRFLFSQGFRKLDFVGMCPMLNEKSETSLFYRINNCMGL